MGALGCNLRTTVSLFTISTKTNASSARNLVEKRETELITSANIRAKKASFAD